jgi:putative transferase (TIGR04331 family)
MKYIVIHPEIISSCLMNSEDELFVLRGRCEYSSLCGDSSNKVKFIFDIDEFSNLKTKDRVYLDKTYESELESLSNTLNAYHEISLSKPNWEILIGPWLRVFIYVLYQKWLLINSIKDKNEYSLLSIKREFSQVIPNCFNDFNDLIADHEWNDYMDSLIATVLGMSVNHISPKAKQGCKKIHKKKGDIPRIKKNYQKFVTSFFSKFSNRKTLVTGVAPLALFSSLIILFFRTFPMVVKRKPLDCVKDTNLDESFRVDNQTILNTNKFQSFIRTAILLNIPRFYLEDYHTRVLSLKEMPVSEEVEYIFTSTSHWADEFFKLWLSINKTKNSKLIIFQHGGTYGTTKHLIHQEYVERKISDYYLTWGWREAGNKKIVPFISNLAPLRVYYRFLKKNNNILIISTRVKSASKGDPWDSSLWNEDYIKNIIFITNRINDLFNNAGLVRLHPSQDIFGDEYFKYLNKKIANVRFDSEKNLDKSVFRAKLNIVTQNSTVLLKCLLWNLPVMCYWNETLNPLNNDAAEYFDLLKNAGISYNSAKSLIESVGDTDIDIWWNSDQVQSARIKFCHEYINSSIDNIFSAMHVIKK